MGKHRAGNRRIVSISIPEDLDASNLIVELKKDVRRVASATISRLIEQGLRVMSHRPFQFQLLL